MFKEGNIYYEGKSKNAADRVAPACFSHLQSPVLNVQYITRAQLFLVSFFYMSYL
jgi:hypothetical protein